MLTGDSRTTATAVGRELGIDDIVAEVQPDQKAEKIRGLQSAGRRVAMAGDGINDAPALAASDVGIAMGTGADIALESAAVTLLKGDLTGILRARRLSRAIMRNIRREPVLRLCLQHGCDPGGRRRALSAVGIAAQPDYRSRGHELQLGHGGQQRAASSASRL